MSYRGPVGRTPLLPARTYFPQQNQGQLALIVTPIRTAQFRSPSSPREAIFQLGGVVPTDPFGTNPPAMSTDQVKNQYNGTGFANWGLFAPAPYLTTNLTSFDGLDGTAATSSRPGRRSTPPATRRWRPCLQMIACM